ncbi:hypothetical protein TorRG33x02_299790 [Trema orientale]|uniref:Uncharacterized protein n=1 Tax=Trema orientale TaxID=63057 RepID=A0A2P5C2T7_TREOI|nr:hypothetical protein TorRG33x02_299790 [Trema orientale]
MMHQVLFPPGEEIIDDDHAVTPLDQTVHEVRPDETRPARDHDPLPLPLEPQRDLPARIPALNPEAALVVDRAVAQVVRPELDRERVEDRVVAVPLGSSGGGREEREAHGRDGNADEDEYQPLLPEDVADRTGHDEPRLERLRRVGVSHGLGLVTPENQLRTHRNACLLRRNVSIRKNGFLEKPMFDLSFSKLLSDLV